MRERRHHDIFDDAVKDKIRMKHRLGRDGGEALDDVLVFLHANEMPSVAGRLVDMMNRRPMDFVAKVTLDEEVLARMKRIGHVTPERFVVALGTVKQALWRLHKYGSTTPTPGEPL